MQPGRERRVPVSQRIHLQHADTSPDRFVNQYPKASNNILSDKNVLLNALISTLPRCFQIPEKKKAKKKKTGKLK